MRPKTILISYKVIRIRTKAHSTQTTKRLMHNSFIKINSPKIYLRTRNKLQIIPKMNSI